MLLDFLKKQDIEYSVQFDISTASYIKIGGKAACAAMPNSTEKLIKLVDFLKEENIPPTVPGIAKSDSIPQSPPADKERNIFDSLTPQSRLISFSATQYLSHFVVIINTPG